MKVRMGEGSGSRHRALRGASASACTCPASIAVVTRDPREEDMDDATWMRRALALAERGRRTVSPNPLVGCLLVRDGEVVGEGWHERAGGPHGEVAALAVAGGRARGATAYVTLEPCAHTGRTGPCTTALLEAGVAAVVVALADPNPVAAGGADVLRAAGLEVAVGLLAAEAQAQNAVFLHGIAHARPFVVAKVAVSLDGRIAAADGTSQWLTGAVARQQAHALRAEVDAVLVGSGTVLADDPALTCRLEGHDGAQPLRAVLDGRGRTPEGAQVTDDAAPTVILTTQDAAPGLGDRLADRVTVAAVPADADGVLDLDAVLAVLWERQVRSVLVEGGAAVLHSALAAGLVDRLHVHVAPVLLGDRGRPMLAGPWAGTLADAPRFALEAVTPFGDDVLLTYRPTDTAPGED